MTGRSGGSITYRPAVQGTIENKTTQSYTPFGILASSVVPDARLRTVDYVSNAMDQVIRRSETDNNPVTSDSYEVCFRFDGHELGHVGNIGTLETSSTWWRSGCRRRTAMSAVRS